MNSSTKRASGTEGTVERAEMTMKIFLETRGCGIASPLPPYNQDKFLSAAWSVVLGEPFHLDGDRFAVEAVFPCEHGGERDVVVIRSLEAALVDDQLPCRAVTVLTLARWIAEGRVDPLFSGELIENDWPEHFSDSGLWNDDKCVVDSEDGCRSSIYPAW